MNVVSENENSSKKSRANGISNNNCRKENITVSLIKGKKNSY